MDAQFPIQHGASDYLIFMLIGVLLPLLLWITFYYNTIFLNGRGKLELPPGPAPIPVLGNLHLLGKLPHRSYLRLSKKYGPIMRLRLGSVPTVVVSSAGIAMEILKTHDRSFASRPITTVGKSITYDYSDVSLCPYNSHWRCMRKVLSSELLSLKRLQQDKNLRMQEVCAMLESIRDENYAAAMNGCDHEVDIVSKLGRMGLDHISRIVLNERFTSSTNQSVLELRTLLDGISGLFRAFILADYVPCLSWFDPSGHKNQLKNIHKKVDRVLDQILREHEEAPERASDQGFLDSLLRIQKAGKEDSNFLSTTAIKATVLEMLFVGSSTSVQTIVWAVSELLRNPELLKQAHTEVDAVVGRNRMVDESDIPQLTFLQAVVKETFRLHPPAPLLLPHESLEDCKVAGYDVPRATRVLVNAWAIGRDPSVWERPLHFDPQRFLDASNSNDAHGQNISLIAFGWGRRGCPGKALGSTIVHLTLACLLHCFDWSLPEGQNPKELDMQEAPGLVSAKLQPLMVILSPRVSSKCYMEHLKNKE